MTIETIAPSDRGLWSIGRIVWTFLLKIRRNRRTRLHLSDLSDAALEDIGLSRREAEAEARRWIWL